MSAADVDLDAYLDVEERESKKIQPRNLRRLIAHILKHPRLLAAGSGMILLGTAAALLEPRLFGHAIDEAIRPGDWELLQRLAMAFFLLICVRAGATIAQGYLFEALGQRVIHDLRCRLFSHLQRLPISVFDRNPAGRLMTRVMYDTSSLGEMFSAGFVSMISNTLLVLGILGWLLILDLRLGLIAASVFPLMILSGAYFSSRLRVSYREARSKLSALNAFLAENLMGMKVVHLFNRQRLHLARFARLNEWYAGAQISTVRIFALFQPSITLAAGISMALVVWFGGGEAVRGNLKLGVLAAYFSYVMALFQPIREIADKWNIFLSGMASAERIFSVLNWPTEIDGEAAQKKAEPIAALRGQIVFENVWFAYEGENWVLKDFSVEIPAGSKVGVVGHTGAGKTTLISLLLRFYEPQRGRIWIDGKDIREYDKRALRASIGMIQQEAFVFSGSFKDNVTFWGSAPASASASELLSVAKADSVEIQERGSNLSMGEKQVLSFARALAAGPRIWILDEATANMDSGTESSLQEYLGRYSMGRTSILIAHRLATVRKADLILVLHMGRLVEKGVHDELLGLGGLYSRLYRYQAAAVSLER